MHVVVNRVVTFWPISTSDLMSNFCYAQGNQAKVVAKLQSELHNPIGLNLVLLPIENGQGFNFKRSLDFLACGHKPKLQEHDYH